MQILKVRWALWTGRVLLQFTIGCLPLLLFPMEVSAQHIQLNEEGERIIKQKFLESWVIDHKDGKLEFVTPQQLVENYKEVFKSYITGASVQMIAMDDRPLLRLHMHELNGESYIEEVLGKPEGNKILPLRNCNILSALYKYNSRTGLKGQQVGWIMDLGIREASFVNEQNEPSVKKFRLKTFVKVVKATNGKESLRTILPPVGTDAWGEVIVRFEGTASKKATLELFEKYQILPNKVKSEVEKIAGVDPKQQYSVKRVFDVGDNLIIQQQTGWQIGIQTKPAIGEKYFRVDSAGNWTESNFRMYLPFIRFKFGLTIAGVNAPGIRY